MDSRLREAERRLRSAPGDGSSALQQARSLVRAGRLSEARELLTARLAAREVDGPTVGALREVLLGLDALRPAASSVAIPRTHVDLVVRGRGGGTELAPTVAFTGLRGAEAWRYVQGLLRAFLGDPPRAPGPILDKRFYLAVDEPLIDFQVPLAAPWPVAPGYTVRTLRVLTLPGAPRAVKHRRELLPTVSALALVEQPGASEAAHRGALERLAQDFRQVHGRGLEGFPALVLSPRETPPARHAGLAAGLGVSSLSRLLVGREGAPRLNGLDVLAALLVEVAQGVQGLVRPRATPA